MSSKCGGYKAGIRGHEGHGKAFDASRPNLSSDEMFCQNSVGAAVGSKDGDHAEEEKVTIISSKTTSNGGCGGQNGKSAEDLQVGKVAEKLALLCPNPSVKFADKSQAKKFQNSLTKFCENSAMLSLFIRVQSCGWSLL